MAFYLGKNILTESQRVSMVNSLVAIGIADSETLSTTGPGKGSDAINFSGKTISPLTVSATGSNQFGTGYDHTHRFSGRIALGSLNGPLSYGDLQYCGIQNFGRYGIDGNYAAIQHTTDDSCALFGFFKARGTQAAPLSVINNDDLGELSFHGWDGTTFVKGGILTPIVDGSVTTGIIPTALRFWTMGSDGLLKQTLTLRADQTAEFKASVKVQTGTLGYATGAGGAVTQLTSKSTPVTLNTASGRITLHAAALASGSTVTFTLNNSLIKLTDVLTVIPRNPTTWGDYQVWVGGITDGQCGICVKNVSNQTLSDALFLNFAIISAVAA